MSGFAHTCSMPLNAACQNRGKAFAKAAHFLPSWVRGGGHKPPLACGIGPLDTLKPPVHLALGHCTGRHLPTKSWHTALKLRLNEILGTACLHLPASIELSDQKDGSNPKVSSAHFSPLRVLTATLVREVRIQTPQVVFVSGGICMCSSTEIATHIICFSFSVTS